jgi:hypothetical protein
MIFVASANDYSYRSHFKFNRRDQSIDKEESERGVRGGMAKPLSGQESS